MGRTMLTATDTAPASPRPPSSAPPSPTADRVPRRRWRDWRLSLGVLLVLGSVVLGARVVAAADDTVTVWAAGSELVAGTPLQVDDVVPVQVRLDAPDNPYLAGPVPDGYLVTRDVGAGELVPASAVAEAREVERTTRLVALAVPAEALPGRLAAGDRVDVWLVPDTLAEPDAAASLLVDGVSVASVPAVDSGFVGSSSPGSVVVSVDADAVGARTLQDVTSRLVAASAAGRVALTLDPAPR